MATPLQLIDVAELRQHLARVVARVCPAWLAAQRDDLVQSALMRLLKLLEVRPPAGPTFRSGAQSDQSEGNPPFTSSYLYKVAYSALVDEIRRVRRRRETDLEDEAVAHAAVASDNPERTAASIEIGRGIQACLTQMKRERRLAVTLHLQGHSVSEAARILDWQAKRTENLVYRGLADLPRLPDLEGDAAVNGRHLDDDVLRRAFEALAESAAGKCSEEDLNRIWLALGGELPPVERRALVEQLTTSPALAEAWRVAHELRRGLPVAIPEERQRAAWWSASWLAAAAAVLLLAVTVVLVSRRDQSGDDTLRDPGRYVIESLVASDAELPREAFRLRWSPGPQDARYQVRVTTEDLRVLTTTADLAQPELVIDRALLAGVTPGSRVFWQVEVTMPGGERETSPTFVVRVGN